MADEGFRFRQFTIQHARSSMKVGTDAVLLGAWAQASEQARILDIGTGCGVIALMMAQRFPLSQVTGIDVDEASIEEANLNAHNANRVGQVEFRAEDLRTHQVQQPYDCIVCNPPYFTEDTLPPDERRARARNSSALSFQELTKAAARLLHPAGLFSVVLPTKETDAFTAECLVAGLHLVRRCDVRTTPRKQPKRSLLTFSPTPTNDLSLESLTLMNPDGSRSEAYATLCHDFYL